MFICATDPMRLNLQGKKFLNQSPPPVNPASQPSSPLINDLFSACIPFAIPSCPEEPISCQRKNPKATKVDLGHYKSCIKDFILKNIIVNSDQASCLLKTIEDIHKLLHDTYSNSSYEDVAEFLPRIFHELFSNLFFLYFRDKPNIIVKDENFFEKLSSFAKNFIFCVFILDIHREKICTDYAIDPRSYIDSYFKKLIKPASIKTIVTRFKKKNSKFLDDTKILNIKFDDILMEAQRNIAIRTLVIQPRVNKYFKVEDFIKVLNTMSFDGNLKSFLSASEALKGNVVDMVLNVDENMLINIYENSSSSSSEYQLSDSEEDFFTNYKAESKKDIILFRCSMGLITLGKSYIHAGQFVYDRNSHKNLCSGYGVRTYISSSRKIRVLGDFKQDNIPRYGRIQYLKDFKTYELDKEYQGPINDSAEPTGHRGQIKYFSDKKKTYFGKVNFKGEPELTSD